ncbi:MAG: hypothetical protein U1D99_11330 [Candidatus Omnitrophota bacterium]|nr:hypothetical protein [Candidatus Omnitrophota bacterium]
MTLLRLRIKAWVDRQYARGTLWGKSVRALHLLAWRCRIICKILIFRPRALFSLGEGDLDPARYPSLRLRIFGHRVLKEILPACRSVGFRPFLTCGTLLGFRRENQFIRDDADIDLGLMEEDRGRVSLLEDRLRRTGYKVRMKNEYFISFRKPVYDDIHVDFFYHFHQDGQVFTVTPDGETLLKYFHTADVFANLAPVRFYGQPILVPGETEKYLTQKYGNWEIPRRDLDPRDKGDYPNLMIEGPGGRPVS